MFHRLSALFLAALTLTACGTQTANPTAPLRSDAALQARARIKGSYLWLDMTGTGTGNMVTTSMTLNAPEVGAKSGPSGHLKLIYADRTGYFSGKSTLNAYVKVATTRGELEFKNVPLTQARRDEKATYFSADVPLQLASREDEPTAITLAFNSSDRYGNLRWDSDHGQNYTLKPTR
ncbi:MAG: hypothetical protein VKP62_11960 [Candidatus Sericytochromatia bacterium]|nr:hypothetical protein [Candidatus Sericytochromatia bacterium]